MHETAEWLSDRRARAHGVRRHRPKPRRTRKAPASARGGSAAEYDRKRDLPGLIALWPWEIEDASVESHRRLVVKLRRALRRERKHGLAGNWTYDVVRHARLLAAYKCEAASLEARLGTREEVGKLRPPEIRS